ncbi:uncharacterized protein EI90DRAFT_3290896 [Cantharellus anzutake]|uniref:uncharacterized protein n=1 Tax=Cantharellus anzutake TaxID=1750568 RepID=UPI001903B6FA|nr:uncharacterized protein EI90DRAFT_3290896 [Cantharellus anzutake]KAF8327567.1 hypothetical protein EI90DRAFT_3290896 [Cantharellus anzutake]
MRGYWRDLHTKAPQDGVLQDLSLFFDGLPNEGVSQVDRAQDPTKPSHLLGVPYEIALHIFTFLDFETLRDGMSLTSRNIRHACGDILFRAFKYRAVLCSNDFGELHQFTNTSLASLVKHITLQVTGPRSIRHVKGGEARRSLETLIDILSKFPHLIKLELAGVHKLLLESSPTVWTSFGHHQLESVTLSMRDDITQLKWGRFLTSQPCLQHLAISNAKTFDIPPIPSLKTVEINSVWGNIRFPNDMSTLHALEYLSVKHVTRLSLSDLPSLKRLDCYSIDTLITHSTLPNLKDVRLSGISDFIFPPTPLPSLSRICIDGAQQLLARGCTTLHSVELCRFWGILPDLNVLKDSASSLRHLIYEIPEPQDVVPPSYYRITETFTCLISLTVRFSDALLRLHWPPSAQKCPTSSLLGLLQSLKHLAIINWDVKVLRVDPQSDPTTQEVVDWLDNFAMGCMNAGPSLLDVDLSCHRYISPPEDHDEPLYWRRMHTRSSVEQPFALNVS